MLNPIIENYFDNLKKYQKEVMLLREIILKSNLTEDFKWRNPCYTFSNKNIVLLHYFKDYCALLFFKGVYLKDKDGVLIQQTENIQTARQWRFNNVTAIKKNEKKILEYVLEAIEIEKSGIKHQPKPLSDLPELPELNALFSTNPNFKTAFEKLTLGRKKGYLLYFDSAKQSKTKTERIKKYIPRILKGYGLRDCTCGLSKRMPNCDGSHSGV